MSNQKTKNIAAQAAQKAKVAAAAKPTPSSRSTLQFPILFGKQNWMLFFAGIALITIGFLMMSGGKTTDPNVFPAEDLYSTMRITIAPIFVLAGFAVEILAIMKKPVTA